MDSYLAPSDSSFPIVTLRVTRTRGQFDIGPSGIVPKHLSLGFLSLKPDKVMPLERDG